MRSLPPLFEGVDAEEVIAALAPVLGPRRTARLDAMAGGRLAGVTALLEDIRDPHNAGAVLRSCEAMGLLRVHLVTSRQEFRVSPRVTQGCEKWMEIHRHPDPEACADRLRADGFRIFAAMPDAELRVDGVDATGPVALAFGNEHVGLSPRLLDLCDGTYRIPMYGASQSLNVSVSAAVSLHAVTEARRRHVGGRCDLDERTLSELRARYYAGDLRGARAIILRRRDATTRPRPCP